MRNENNDIPPCMIYIDKEGKWFHKDREMIHREIIRHFYRHMEMDSEGRCVIRWQGERCYVEVEDTPYVVVRAALEDSDHPGERRIVLSLSDGEHEDLSPATLRVGNENVLYCKVREGSFPARFSRAAYYQIAQYIEEDKGKFYLQLNGRRYAI